MKIDLSKKDIRKVNTICICSTNSPQDARVSTFANTKFHIVIDTKGGRFYFLPYGDKYDEFENDVSVKIAFVGGGPNPLQPIDNRTEFQKIALIHAIKDIFFWMRHERIDLSPLRIKGESLAFSVEEEYGNLMISENYKRS